MASFNLPEEARILVGVSGGMDSMALLHVLHNTGFQVTAAHVNFTLRPGESEKEAALVKNWCAQNAIPCLYLEADTRAYAMQHHCNIQVAAREIRYSWWEALTHSGHYDVLATAHHLEDQIESVLIHLLRGTGLKGLRGMPRQRDAFIRPLLEISGQEIRQYVLAQEVPYATDSSNLKDDYLRNRLRHHLVPLLEDLSPGFSARMKHTLFRTALEWGAWERAFDAWKILQVIPDHSAYHLLTQPGDEAFILRWLEDQGIPWSLAFDFITGRGNHSTGALCYGPFRLSGTAEGYYFEKITTPQDLLVPGPGRYETDEFVFTLEETAWEGPDKSFPPHVAYLNRNVVSFPLEIRAVQPGDRFHPIGMQGHSKKIQDLLVDHKLEMHEKQRVRLLIAGGQILWVTGIRLDEHAKVGHGETTAYKAVMTWKK